MKIRRSKLLPAALLIYLGAIAVYAWPGKNADKNALMQYGLTIGVTLICIVLLSFFLKKREKFEDENRKLREEKKNQSKTDNQ